MRRNITASIAAAVLLAPVPAFAAADVDWPEYERQLSNYGKAMVAAKISAKYCKAYGFDWNREMFYRTNIPELWAPEKMDAFLNKVMVETRDKINAQVSRIGLDNYCITYMAFARATNPPNELPIRFTHRGEE